jgi:phospholipid/cholesterol/gamma-HCH transport system substrate-binding protein
MDSQSTYKAGLFVLFGVVLTLVGYVLLIGSIGGGDRYLIRLTNLGGLEVGAAVEFEGYSIGTVDSIEPLFDGDSLTFEVALMVESDWPIFEDSLATISSDNLLAPKSVQISRGNSATIQPVGSEIPVTEPVDALSGVLKTASQFERLVQDEFVPVLRTVNTLLDGEVRDSVRGATQVLEPLAEEAPELLARLSSTVERIERMLDDQTVDTFQESTRDLSEILSETRGLVTSIRRDFEGEIQPKVVSVLSNVESMTGDELLGKAEQSLDEVHQAAQKANALATRFDELSDRSDDRILAIIDRLERAAMNLEDMTATLRQEPSRLVRGSE